MGILSGAVGFVLDLMSDPTRDEMHTREANGWERYHDLRREHEQLKDVQRATYAAVKRRGNTIIELSKKLGMLTDERDKAHEETRLLERKYNEWAQQKVEELTATRVTLMASRSDTGLAKEALAVVEKELTVTRASLAGSVLLGDHVLKKERDDAIESKARAEKERDTALAERDLAFRRAEGFDLSWTAMKAQRDEARGKTIEAVGLMTEAIEERDAAIEARDLAVKKYDLYRDQLRKAGDQINPLLQKGHERIAELKEDNSRLVHATDTLAEFVDVVISEFVAEDEFLRTKRCNCNACIKIRGRV